MFSQDSKKIDVGVSVFASTVFAASVLLLINDTWMWQSQRSRHSLVGKVIHAVNDVRSRPDDDILWQPVHEEYPLHLRDSVFTGEVSGAELSLINGGSLKLSPKTLVVLSFDDQGKNVLTLENGSLTGTMGSRVRLLVTGKAGVLQEVHSERGTLQVQRNQAGTTAISVWDGEATLSNEGKETKIHASEQLTVSPSNRVQIQKQKLILNLPKRNDRLLRAADEKIHFEWSGAGTAQYRFDLGDSPEFDHLIYSSNLTKNFIDLSEVPARGTFYWRVSDANDPTALSAVNEFTLVSDSPPDLVSPPENAKLTYPQKLDKKTFSLFTPATRAVIAPVLQLQDQNHFGVYEVQIAADPDFNQILFSKVSHSLQNLGGELTQGTYYWRARAEESDMRKSAWTKPSRFSVVETVLSDFPLPLYPKADETAYLARETLTRFQWHERAGTKEYEVRISKNADFSEAITQKVNQTQLSVELKPDQSYFWKVRAISENLALTEFSPTISFWVKNEPKVVLLSPRAEAEIWSLPGANLTFSWKPVEGAKEYEIQWSKDREFKEISFAKKIGTESLIVPLPGSPPTFYWRVLAKSEKENWISPAQTLRLREVQTPLAMFPAAKARLTIPARMEGKSTGGVSLQWSDPTRSSRYQLQLSDDPAFTKVRVDRTLDTFSIDLTGLEAREYFWRVRSTDPLRPESTWSETQTFTLEEKAIGVPPDLLVPLPQAEIVVPNRQTPVRLEWKPSPDAAAFEIEISRTPGFADHLVSARVKTASFEYAGQEAGTYYWKVREIGRNSEITEFSETRSFGLSYQPRLTLLLPSNGATLWRAPSSEVLFQWEIDSKPQTFHLEMAKDESFNEKILDFETSNPFASFKKLPQEGVVFWRVSAKGKQKSVSEVFRVSLFVGDVPSVKEPVRGSKVEVAKSLGTSRSPSSVQKSVSLAWEDQSRGSSAPSFEVQLAAEAEFTKLLWSTRADQTFTQTPPLSEGEYFWRVRSADRARDSAPWSQIGTFKLVAVEMGEAPQLESPQNGAQVVLEKREQKNISLSWKAQPDAKKYVLEIYSGDSLELLESKRVYRELVSGTQVQAPVPGTGKFIWRVQAVGEEERLSPFSRPWRMELLPKPTKLPLPPPEVGEDNQDIEVWAPRKRTIFEVLSSLILPAAFAGSETGPRLHWKIIPGAVSYRVQISKTANFEELLVDQNSVSPNFAWKSLEPGVYYWRVCGVDEESQQGSFSPAARIVLRLPSPHHLETQAQENEFKLKWEADSRSKKFKVEVSRGPDFVDPRVFSTKKNSLTYTLPEEESSFYWRVCTLGDHDEVISNCTKAPIAQAKLNIPELKKLEAHDEDKQFTLEARWENDLKREIEVQISKDPEFKELLADEQRKDNQIQVPVSNGVGERFYARVRAHVAKRVSKWSNVQFAAFPLRNVARTNELESISESRADPVNQVNPSQFRFELGPSSLNYQETSGPAYHSTLLAGVLQYAKRDLLSKQLGVHFEGGVRALNLNSSVEGASFVLVSAGAEVTHDWSRFDVSAGAFYSTTFVSQNAFGYKNFYGPRLQFRYFLPLKASLASVGLKVETAPTALQDHQLTALVRWESRAAQSFPWSLGLEFSSLKMSFQEVMNVSSSMVSLLVGTYW